MDCGKEMYEKISVKIQQEKTIWMMVDVIAADNCIAMEEITGNDYSSVYDRRFYDEDEERADYEKYLNSLSSEELKRKDARDATLLEKYM